MLSNLEVAAVEVGGEGAAVEVNRGPVLKASGRAGKRREGGQAEATVTEVGGPRGERRGSAKHPGGQ